MNLRKPDIEIYNEVLKYHNIKPENMFFTDDNQENIDAAKKTGIRAYTFKNVIKLKQDLADFGIEV
jgi:putative hydrolase of the HAD superfamily